MEFEVIPQQAIDTLIAEPETSEAFDQVFGKGRAAEVFAAQNPVPKDGVEDEDLAFAGKVWDASGRAVGRGVQEAANETVGFIESFDIWASKKLDTLGVPSRLQIYETNPDGTLGKFNPQLKFYHESLNDRDFLGGTVGVKGDNAEINLVAKPQTLTGGLVAGASQFAAGFIGAGKVTKLAGIRGAFVNGAIADAVVFDPDDPNITAMLEHFDIDTGVVGEVLATNPDDPEYINRIRNATEGVVAGGVVEAIGWSFKAARARAAGDLGAAKKFTEAQEAALKPLDDAIKQSGAEVAADVRTTLDFKKTVIDPLDDIAPPKADAEGQLQLDLGDTPRAAPLEGAENTSKRIYLTPERAEEIRYHAELAADAPAGKKLPLLSFKSLTTAADFDDVIDEIASTKHVLKNEFDAIKGGDVQRWATVKLQAAAKVRQMATMTGEDPEGLIRKFLTADAGDTSELAAEVLARSSYVLTVEKELKAMAKAISDGVFDSAQFPGIKDLNHLRLAFQQRREVAANLLAGQEALRSNVARAMNAMKIAVQDNGKLREMLKDPSMFRDVDAAARAVADPSNTDKPAMRTIDEALGKVHGFMDKVNTFRINMLLSGPGTQEVNFISNVVNSFVIPAEQLAGGFVTADRRMMLHAARQLQGYVAGLMDSVGTAVKATVDNEAILDQITKIEDDALKSAVTGVKAVDNVITLPTRFLMGMDEFFKQSQYRGRVFADAHEEAYRQGLKGPEKEAFIKEYLSESYDDLGMATRGDALLQARKATFTEPLEGGLAASLQMLAIKYPLIRFIMPFVRTPINLLSQTFQHVPVAGALSNRWKADFAAGGVRRAQAIGKWVVGSGLIAAAGYLASSGQITGSGPSDPRIRKVWLQNNQPYAVRIDNEDGTVSWLSYARLEPLSNLFSIAADMVEINNDEFNEASTQGVFNAMFLAVMENTVNKTFTQGIYDFMAMLTGSKQYEREAAMRNFIASFSPNALNQLNGDEYMREVRTLTDAFMARSHLYNNVDPKRNVLGEPVIRRLPKYDPLGLADDDTREIDRVLEEITRLAIENQTVASHPARKIKGPNKVDLARVPYTEGQSLYDKWIELTGEVKIGGKTLREKLSEQFDEWDHRAAQGLSVPVDGYQNGTATGTKGAIIGKIIMSYREKAKGELPELVELIKSERQGDALFKRTQRRQQVNRELFPLNTEPERAFKRRSFDDLLEH